MRLFALGILLVAPAACQHGLDACSEEADITGTWTINATPLAADAGTPALPMAFSVAAQLTQGASTDFLGIAHYVYGTLTASDPGVFPPLTIPQLTHSDGSKAGTIRGCMLTINVPIATPVTDDDNDQGPLRISLVGHVTDEGMISSLDQSLVILASDSTETPRAFGWTATQAHP